MLKLIAIALLTISPLVASCNNHASVSETSKNVFTQSASVGMIP